ncbi:MAG: hypothetical protein ACYC7J_18345 [Syntrophales bacterium]
MKINVARASYEGMWFDFGDGRLKIRPYPLSKADLIIKDGAVIVSGDDSLEMFDHCLIEWERVDDGGDPPQPLKLTAAVKKLIYDFGLGEVDGIPMSGFVLQTARRITRDISAAAKN